LQNALFSILLALRNDPDRYFIVDRIELTPFATTILNYDSFLAIRRQPYLQGSEEYIERVFEMAEKILYNLQKAMADSTISAAAGRWVFYGIMLFNNTQSESLSILNNGIGLSKSTAPLNEPEYIWLLE
jgi:hypothetical protein